MLASEYTTMSMLRPALSGLGGLDDSIAQRVEIAGLESMRSINLSADGFISTVWVTK